jgi:hypothetical protein
MNLISYVGDPLSHFLCLENWKKVLGLYVSFILFVFNLHVDDTYKGYRLPKHSTSMWSMMYGVQILKSPCLFFLQLWQVFGLCTRTQTGILTLKGSVQKDSRHTILLQVIICHTRTIIPEIIMHSELGVARYVQLKRHKMQTLAYRSSLIVPGCISCRTSLVSYHRSTALVIWNTSPCRTQAGWRRH